MLRLGNTIRLTTKERELLRITLLEDVNPDTVQAHDAWIDHGVQTLWNGDTPEERLMRAILKGQKIEP